MRRKMILPLFVLAAGLSLLCGASTGAEDAAARPAEKGTISGRIVVKDRGPVAGGQVMLYNAASGHPPSVDGFERPPDVMRDTDSEGRFSIEAPEGRYYLKAVKRQSGKRFGPPAEGDFVYRSMDDQGRPRDYHIEAGKTLEIAGDLETVPLKAKSPVITGMDAIVEGIVKDSTGKPVKDVVVIAYSDRSMKGKPLFVSRATDQSGKYLLLLKEGTYYLRIREGFSGRPPQSGELLAYYGDERGPAPVAVTKGEKRRVDFTAAIFPGRGPKIGTAPVNK